MRADLHRAARTGLRGRWTAQDVAYLGGRFFKEWWFGSVNIQHVGNALIFWRFMFFAGHIYGLRAFHSVSLRNYWRKTKPSPIPTRRRQNSIPNKESGELPASWSLLYKNWVVGSFFFIFTPKIGEDSHFDSYFSKELFNHQLERLPIWKIHPPQAGSPCGCRGKCMLHVRSFKRRVLVGCWMRDFGNPREAIRYQEKTGNFIVI